MTRRTILAAALALPLVGLAASWALANSAARQGTEWEVPVAGYDPRDLLRGHYVLYRYDWPGLEGRRTNLALEPVLCLEGEAPRLARVHRPRGDGCEHFVRASGAWNDPQVGLASGRLYVSQDRAARLQRQLADRSLQGVVRIRVRSDGHITPLDIVFRPRGEAAPDGEQLPPIVIEPTP